MLLFFGVSLRCVFVFRFALPGGGWGRMGLRGCMGVRGGLSHLKPGVALVAVLMCRFGVLNDVWLSEGDSDFFFFHSFRGAA